jgi:hypothetical protein
LSFPGLTFIIPSMPGNHSSVARLLTEMI